MARIEDIELATVCLSMTATSAALSNLVSMVISLVTNVAATALLLRAYKAWKFKPLLAAVIGFLFLVASPAFDISCRFQPPTAGEWVGHLMRISGMVFYVGSYLVLYGLLSTQPRPPVARLLAYAFVYGAMCLAYLLPEWNLAVYDPLTGMWYTNPLNYVVFGALMALTVLPTIDILALTIRRLRAPFMNERSRGAVLLLLAGVFLPMFGSSVPYLLPIEGFPSIIVANITLAVGFVLFASSLAIDPLVLAFSKAVLNQVVMTRADKGDLVIAGYSWTRQQTEVILSTQLLTAITKILETQIDAGGGKKELQDVHLDQMDVLIEKNQRFTAYLIVKGSDAICRIGLKRLLARFDELYGGREGIKAHEMVGEEEFLPLIQGIFTFVATPAPVPPRAGRDSRDNSQKSWTNVDTSTGSHANQPGRIPG
ncbi:MAG: hypothetical protein JW839_10095, partial [Candidatus Lokiarchaeota archaeon]|nr:hypothetical protein [Candidatus Lokiarchaeota archaeon]